MSKKVTSAILCVLLVFGMLVPGFSVSAENEITNISSGVLAGEGENVPTPQEQMADVLACTTISTAEKETAVEKLQFMMMSEAERTAQVNLMTTNTRATLVRICYVPHFVQANGYYCGPAVTKQTIHYLTDGANSPTQTALAGYLGTTTAGSSSTNMVSWLATQGYYYTKIDPISLLSESDLKNYVIKGIGTYDDPPFGAIAVGSNEVVFPNETGWHYTTNGHFVNISAILEDTNDGSVRLEVTDPNITRVDPSFSTGKYEVYIGDYYAAMTSFCW